MFGVIDIVNGATVALRAKNMMQNKEGASGSTGVVDITLPPPMGACAHKLQVCSEGQHAWKNIDLDSNTIIAIRGVALLSKFNCNNSYNEL